MAGRPRDAARRAGRNVVALRGITQPHLRPPPLSPAPEAWDRARGRCRRPTRNGVPDVRERDQLAACTRRPARGHGSVRRGPSPPRDADLPHPLDGWCIGRYARWRGGPGSKRRSGLGRGRGPRARAPARNRAPARSRTRAPAVDQPGWWGFQDASRPDLLIIRQGSITIQVADIDDALASAGGAIASMGGYESGSQRTGRGRSARTGDLPIPCVELGGRARGRPGRGPGGPRRAVRDYRCLCGGRRHRGADPEPAGHRGGVPVDHGSRGRDQGRAQRPGAADARPERDRAAADRRPRTSGSRRQSRPSPSRSSSGDRPRSPSRRPASIRGRGGGRDGAARGHAAVSRRRRDLVRASSCCRCWSCSRSSPA